MSSSHGADLEGESVSVDTTTVTVSEKIGSGTEGSVYRVEEFDDRVVKIFAPNRRKKKAEKIRTMIDNDPDHDAIIWPQHAVRTTDTGEFLGYQMKYKSHNTTKNAFEYTMTELGWDSSEVSHRHTVASNLATIVQAIHAEGHAIGDFNHDNILVDEDGQVSLIDCDGFHITDNGKTFADDTYYPRYSPPEGRGGDDLAEVQKADRFCLGVHVFQFLMEGFHPYLAKGSKAEEGSMEEKLNSNKFPYVYPDYEPVTQAPSIKQYEQMVPKYLQKKFKQCFTEAGKNISDGQSIRPNPTEWIKPYTEQNGSGAPEPPTPPTPPGGDPMWENWESINDEDADDEISNSPWDPWDVS